MRRGTWIRALGVRIIPDLKGMMPLGKDRVPEDDDPPGLRPESPSSCSTSTSSWACASLREEVQQSKVQKIRTLPPTPAVLSLECGALSGSIAVTSFFLGSFYYSPDEADKVFPFQVFLESSARSESARRKGSIITKYIYIYI